MDMIEKVIPKQDVKKLIDELRRDYTVVAPLLRDGCPAEFGELKEGDEPALDGSQMMLSPKEYLLPRYETLLIARTKKGDEQVCAAMPESKPTIIMGMWLADAQAIKVLDNVFLNGKYVDPYYSARRRQTALFAVMPQKMRWSWFCNSVDNVENWRKFVDAMWFDLGSNYYVEFNSDMAKRLSDNPLFVNPTSEQAADRDRLWNRFLSITTMPFAGLCSYSALTWDNPVWRSIADRCLSCGLCSYICPSCSCFDIQDEVRGDCVERYRCRDACQFEDFTLMGHGHNPRHEQLPRSRQRLLHKFSYQGDQFGIVGCTGCGRCVEMCPVGIDVREILRQCATGDAVAPDADNQQLSADATDKSQKPAHKS